MVKRLFIQKYFLPIVAFTGALGFNSCETQDVVQKTAWSWSISKSICNEADSVVYIKFEFSEPAFSTYTIDLKFDGTATENKDYSITSKRITIPKDSSTIEIPIYIIQDTAQESTETLQITSSSKDGLELPVPASLNLQIEDDDKPVAPNLLLNEILYDPSNNALDGDANGDGVYAQAADEFIEIINYSSSALNMSGFKVFDAENYRSNIPNHTFPSGTILNPGKALVLFGGGTPKGTFGNALVQTSTSGDLNLNNAGDTLYIVDLAGKVLLNYDIEPLSNNPNESYSRNPDLTGDFIQHSAINSKLFSPGTKSNGDPF